MMRVESSDEKDEAVSERWFYNPPLGESHDQGAVKYFDNGIIFEKDTLSSRVFSVARHKFNPFKQTVFFNGRELFRKENKDSPLKSGALVLETGESWQSIGFSDKRLINSLITRLYFMNGYGLKHFEFFLKDEKAGIYVYRIKWEQ